MSDTYTTARCERCNTGSTSDHLGRLREDKATGIWWHDNCARADRLATPARQRDERDAMATVVESVTDLLRDAVILLRSAVDHPSAADRAGIIRQSQESIDTATRQLADHLDELQGSPF